MNQPRPTQAGIPEHSADYGMRVPVDTTDNAHWGCEFKDQQPTVLCFHGRPTRYVEIQKDGPYKGQMVYLCTDEEERCNVFLQDCDLDNPVCRCGVKTRENIVKKPTANEGRKFLSCGARKCGYFKWQK
jgi:hypothetical protein